MKFIIGFGNILFGDDGFGPSVIEYLEKNYEFPLDVKVIDGGTTVDYLLNFLTEEVEKLIIIDIFHMGKNPGEVFVINSEKIKGYPQRLTHFLSVPKILNEIRKISGVEIYLVVCEPKEITTPNVKIGLSEPVKRSVPKAAEMVEKLIKEEGKCCVEGGFIYG